MWMDTPRLPPGRLIIMSRVKPKAYVDMLAYVMYITTYLNPNVIFFGA